MIGALVGLLKVGNIVIFGPCLRWADMRHPGLTTLVIAITGDQCDRVDLTGDDDREFRKMFEDGGPTAGLVVKGSEGVN